MREWEKDSNFILKKKIKVKGKENLIQNALSFVQSSHWNVNLILVKKKKKKKFPLLYPLQTVSYINSHSYKRIQLYMLHLDIDKET